MSELDPARMFRGVEHIGLGVPDMNAAEHFLCAGLGARRIFAVAGREVPGSWFESNIGARPDTRIREIRMYRVGNGPNLELFEYESWDAGAFPPRHGEPGAHHLAFYTDDIDAAVGHLRAHGAVIQGEVKSARGAVQGQRWVYFRTPWGLQCELVNAPDALAYEREASAVMWRPSPQTD